MLYSHAWQAQSRHRGARSAMASAMSDLCKIAELAENHTGSPAAQPPARALATGNRELGTLNSPLATCHSPLTTAAQPPNSSFIIGGNSPRAPLVIRIHLFCDFNYGEKMIYCFVFLGAF